jgi:hypothetical protein
MSEPAFRSASDEEWDDLMRQLRDRPKASPRPFFYSRVNARLTTGAVRGRVWPEWVLRPIYAALLGAMVLTLSGDGSALHATASTTRGNAADSSRPMHR